MKRAFVLFLPFILICAGMAALAMWLDGARPRAERLPAPAVAPDPAPVAPAVPAEPPDEPVTLSSGALQIGSVHTDPDQVFARLNARGNGAFTNLVESMNNGSLTPLQVASNLLANANDLSVKAVDPELLRGVLPPSTANWVQGKVRSGPGGGLFMNTASAEAVYKTPEGRTATLKVMDTGSMKAVTLFARDLAGSVDLVQTNAAGLVRTSQFRGHALFEKFAASRAKAAAHLFVHDRFYIQAEGRGVSQEQLRELLGGLDLDRLPAPGTSP